MIQAATRPAVVPVFPSLPESRFRSQSKVTVRRAVQSRLAAKSTTHGWLDAFLGTVMLCGFTGVAIAAYAWVGRVFVDELLKYNAFDLLRAFGAA